MVGRRVERRHSLYQLRSQVVSASLVGRPGVKHVRLSTTAVSISLTGSCFSSEIGTKAHAGSIRRRGGTV